MNTVYLVKAEHKGMLLTFSTEERAVEYVQESYGNYYLYPLGNDALGTKKTSKLVKHIQIFGCIKAYDDENREVTISKRLVL